MRVTLESGNRSLFALAIQHLREIEPPRTGVHCSDIIHDIRESQARGKAPDPIEASTMVTFQELGNVVEDVLAEALAHRFPGWVKPEPRMTPEGIICSPDGFSVRGNCIDEVKCCWKSYKDFFSLTDPAGTTRPLQEVIDQTHGGRERETFELAGESDKFFFYRLQTFFYMRAWQAERCRIHVFFLNGNYKPPFPRPVTIAIRPTRAEVEAMHDLLIQHAKDRGLIP